MSECPHAKDFKFPGIKRGKICSIDGSLCLNYDRPDFKEKCPTYQSAKKVPITGLYKGVPKCFRKGKFGTFNGGMPPEYLRRLTRKKKN